MAEPDGSATDSRGGATLADGRTAVAKRRHRATTEVQVAQCRHMALLLAGRLHDAAHAADEMSRDRDQANELIALHFDIVDVAKELEQVQRRARRASN